MPFPPFFLPDYPGDLGPPVIFLEGIPSAEAIGALGSNISTVLEGIPSEEAFGTLGNETLYTLVGFDASEPVSSLLGSTEAVPEGVDFNRVLRPLRASERLSSPVINQNFAHTDKVALTYVEDEYPIYQEFYLPKDYIRGEESIPPLTGFQVLTNVRVGYKDTATLDWVLETYEIGSGWQELDSGISTGSEIDGQEVWFMVYFNKLVRLSSSQVTNKFRVGLRGRNHRTSFFKQQVPYSGQALRVELESIPAEIVPGKPFHFVYLGEQMTAYLDPLKETVYISNETGVRDVWLTYPNPLATQFIRATDTDGVPLQFLGEQVSLNFRVLAGVAEEGKDYLGNRYRSVVRNSDVNNATIGREASYWLSKPNPSKFAVESIYFDVSDSLNRESTIDSINVDPITPGVHFNIYYSSEGDPTTDNDVWENKLWTRLPQNFVARQKQAHALIRPITARYIKVEFTQLQARSYSAGSFQKPILYRKHPKWVLDYFLLRIAAEDISDDKFIARNLEVSYNAYDLAYNYYLDDLRQYPDSVPILDEDDLFAFLNERNDASDKIDTNVLNAIQTRFKQYTSTLNNFSQILSYLPRQYNYNPTTSSTGLREDDRNFLPDPSTDVSSLDRDNLIYERSQPAMYFFIPCRHRYRLLSASFQNNKAYFAGVNEIAFLRDKYTKAYDSPLYIEAAGDTLNSRRNDFTIEDGIWMP